MVRFVRPHIKRRKSGIQTTNALHHRHRKKGKRQIGTAMVGDGKRASPKHELITTTQPFSKPTLSLSGSFSKKSIKRGTAGMGLLLTARPRRKPSITVTFTLPSIAKMIARERRQERARLRRLKKIDLTRAERIRAAELRRLERAKLGEFRKKLPKDDPFKKVPIRQFKDKFPRKIPKKDFPSIPTKVPIKEIKDEVEVRVKSSMVYGFAYNEDLQILTVRWNQAGKMGFYEDVPKYIFEKVFNGVSSGCKTAGQNEWGRWWVTKNPSVGRAMWDHIFGKYHYVKIL